MIILKLTHIWEQCFQLIGLSVYSVHQYEIEYIQEIVLRLFKWLLQIGHRYRLEVCLNSKCQLDLKHRSKLLFEYSKICHCFQMKYHTHHWSALIAKATYTNNTFYFFEIPDFIWKKYLYLYNIIY